MTNDEKVEIRECVEAAVKATHASEIRSHLRWRLGRLLLASIAVLTPVGVAYFCFSPIIKAVVSDLPQKPPDQTTLWLYALGGLYMSAVAIAGVIGVSSILKEE